MKNKTHRPNSGPATGTAHIRYKDEELLRLRNQIILCKEKLYDLAKEQAKQETLLIRCQQEFTTKQTALAESKILVAQIPTKKEPGTRKSSTDTRRINAMVAALKGLPEDKQEALMLLLKKGGK